MLIYRVVETHIFPTFIFNYGQMNIFPSSYYFKAKTSKINKFEIFSSQCSFLKKNMFMHIYILNGANIIICFLRHLVDSCYHQKLINSETRK
jgi:hypothetical protein